MICQELKCKKQESQDHIGTLCKRHGEILERCIKQSGMEYDPFTYKTINEKGSVWENGCEHVRGIKTSQIKEWINIQENKKQTFVQMLEVIQEQITTKDTKIQELVKMKNSRYVKN